MTTNANVAARFRVADVDRSMRPRPSTQAAAADVLRGVGQAGRCEAMLVTAPISPYVRFVKDAFVGAVVAAYNDHCPLALDPDAIWLKIAQAVGIYANAAPEQEVRSRLVRHGEGAIELSVNVDKHGVVLGRGTDAERAASWAGAVSAMTEQIGQHATPDAADALFAEFSGTQPVHRTALRGTLMSMVQNYFKFNMYTMCGIPEVTLYGTPGDYDAIVAKAQKLSRLLPGFAWFFDRLMPTLVQLRESAHGRPDIDWWQRAVSVSKGSGVDRVSGWICHFVPYVCPPRRDQPSTLCRAGDAIAFDEIIPSLLEAPFTFTDVGANTRIPMALVSGFMGVSQDPETQELQPVVGWAVLHQAPAGAVSLKTPCACGSC